MFNRAEQRMGRHFTTRFGAVGKKWLAEFLQRIRQLVVFGLFLGPNADLFDPLALVAAVEFASVDPGVFQQ